MAILGVCHSLAEVLHLEDCSETSVRHSLYSVFCEGTVRSLDDRRFSATSATASGNMQGGHPYHL